MASDRRATGYRKAMTIGISASVAAHLAALFVLSVPGAGPGNADPTVDKSAAHPFDALEVVRLPAPNEPQPTVASPVLSTSSSAEVASTAAASGNATTMDAASIDALVASMPPAQMTVSLPDGSRPVVTFRDLERVSQSEAMLAEFAYGAGTGMYDEDDSRGFGSLLGRIGLALSGGGHCPTPAGPMILR